MHTVPIVTSEFTRTQGDRSFALEDVSTVEFAAMGGIEWIADSALGNKLQQ